MVKKKVSLRKYTAGSRLLFELSIILIKLTIRNKLFRKMITEILLITLKADKGSQYIYSLSWHWTFQS